MVVATKESIPIMSKTGFKTVGIGANVRSTLVAASAEHRVVAGMTAAIRSLTEEPHKFVFCFIVQPKANDSGAHMQEVLLEAFCFENDIYIIKVDSAEKLSRLLGTACLVSCALVRKADSITSSSSEDCYSRSENILIDHCEFYWDEPVKPVIKLPEK
ncbi:growth arrest and DNA damage-inducible protein GADD45 alpha-like [Sabethes cyaneus]|uniref:growth arrest and DNA damage-inducible protein GADD45 alpha-like n=1 Tax=Sabethes cyaneus TaxID=53552 RepID=UPI00237DE092|nr:growth arrest and DNA damage-inducible protein GADD45 alpha-like [Sabethes cyaneus]